MGHNSGNLRAVGHVRDLGALPPDFVDDLLGSFAAAAEFDRGVGWRRAGGKAFLTQDSLRLLEVDLVLLCENLLVDARLLHQLDCYGKTLDHQEQQEEEQPRRIKRETLAGKL